MEEFTVQTALDRTFDIKESLGDSEIAFSMEVELRNDFIKAVAHGNYNTNHLQIIAKIILQTDELEFNRYTA